MAKTSYAYSIQSDFPNRKVDSSRLWQEIQNSVITVALDGISVSGDNCEVTFKADVPASEKTVLDGLIAAHSGEPLPQPAFDADGTPIMVLKDRQPDGVPVVAQAPRDGSEWVIGTHNFCDPCSWFGDSVRVSIETLTDSGDGLTFTSVHENWIDVVSGRTHNDDIWVQVQQMLNPSDPHGYQVVVQVDGVTKTMREPFEASGGDYEVIWEDGKVVFFTSQSGKTVTASYSYENGSTFYVRPMPGKVLLIEDAECDTSSDVVMTDTISYASWYFDGTEMVKGMEATFKKAGQIMVEARGAYASYTAKGASAEEKQISDLQEFRRKSRGMKCDRQAAPFNYATAKKLRSEYMQEVRVKTKHDRPLQGEHVTMTFYCLEKDEV